MHRPKTYPKCAASGCNDSGNVAHGLCQLHYGQWRLARRKNSQDLLTHSEIPPFEYEGNEQALIEMTKQQEREKQDLDLPKGEQK